MKKTPSYFSYLFVDVESLNTEEWRNYEEMFHFLTAAVAQFLYKLNSSFVAPNDCFFDKFDENCPRESEISTSKRRRFPRTRERVVAVFISGR